MSILRYPHFPRVPGINTVQQRTLEEWAAGLISELESRDNATVFGSANADPYVMTNVSVQRSMNAATVSTVNAVAQVLGTLISDLKAHGNLA